MIDIREYMQESPVIPVMVIEDLETAVPLANALVKGGLKVLEITLRSAVALDAIEAISASVPGAIVGAGTVNSPEQMKQVRDRGALFAVSPGYTPVLGAAAVDAKLPYLPGVMTPAEILTAMHDGLNALKFFPASKAGGPGFIKALHGPFPEIVFCPTGGISATSSADYLSLANVLCVGGSWVAPKDHVEKGNWDAITQLATAAVSRA